MNKLIFALAVFAVVLAVVAGQEDWKAKMKEMKDECKQSTNYNKDAENKDGPPSKELKCFMNCMGEKMGMMQDGKVNTENFLGFIEKMNGKDSEKYASAKSALEKCNEEVKEDDKCEYAYKYKECMAKHAPGVMQWGKGNKSG